MKKIGIESIRSEWIKSCIREGVLLDRMEFTLGSEEEEEEDEQHLGIAKKVLEEVEIGADEVVVKEEENESEVLNREDSSRESLNWLLVDSLLI